MAKKIIKQKEYLGEGRTIPKPTQKPTKIKKATKN